MRVGPRIIARHYTYEAFDDGGEESGLLRCGPEDSAYSHAAHLAENQARMKSSGDLIFGDVEEIPF